MFSLRNSFARNITKPRIGKETYKPPSHSLCLKIKGAPPQSFCKMVENLFSKNFLFLLHSGRKPGFGSTQSSKKGEPDHPWELEKEGGPAPEGEPGVPSSRLLNEVQSGQNRRKAPKEGSSDPKWRTWWPYQKYRLCFKDPMFQNLILLNADLARAD